MRPRSVIGPLLLIAVGGLLLMNTLRPELPILETLARYWPYLLIGWGVLRLLEIVVWRLRGLPLPACGVSGGEWTAVVLICLIGSGLYAAHRYRPWERLAGLAGKRVELFGRSYDYPIAEQRRAAGPAPRVFLENLRGDARVTGVEGTEIRVSGRKTVRALEESGAAEADRRSPVEISGGDGRIVIRTNLDRVAAEYKIAAELEVALPRGASLEVRGREGDFEVSDLEGSVEITSDNAGVRLQNIGGGVRVNVRRSDLIRVVNVKGPVDIAGGRGRDLEIEKIQGPVTVEGFYSGGLRFAGLSKGLHFHNPQTTLRVEGIAGQIQMDLGELSGVRLEGPIRFTSTRSRDVELDGFTRGAEIAVDGGDVRLRPVETALGPMQVKTRAGDIELAVAEGAAFQLRARTARGSVSNQYGPALKEESEGRHGAVLSGGAAGPLLSLETSRGGITVRKDTGAALAGPRERRGSRVEIETEGGRLQVQRH